MKIMCMLHLLMKIVCMEMCTHFAKHAHMYVMCNYIPCHLHSHFDTNIYLEYCLQCGAFCNTNEQIRGMTLRPGLASFIRSWQQKRKVLREEGGR